ncbi:class I adenylate-forming enzyme family protein [Glutamicibacter sp.]|uniref:class I adenylate-forming enzyme family protein n=1 Tax=Glutamicibacter sp. TaxID=1931995 RepID=UPI0028BDB6CC|nr:class I adenylate-forming enzyme family protein [Glutamicibacter sp.]
MDFTRSLEFWARSAPERIAVATFSKELSFLDLALRAQTFAQQLQDLPFRRIGICTTDPINMAVGFYAAILAEKSLVVLDPSWPEELITKMSGQLGVNAVISETELTDRLTSIQQLLLAPPKPLDELQRVHSTRLPNREMLVICTSGSSGLPKAVVRTQESWQQSVSIGSDILGALPASTTICPGPISHGLGLYALVESIANGGTLIAGGYFNSRIVQSLMERHACTRLVSVPTIIDRMLRLLPRQVLASLTTVVSGGEPLDQRIVNQLFKLPAFEDCIEYYGSSEHSLIAFRHRNVDEVVDREFIGNIFPSVKIHIHDPRPVSGLGEIFVDSPFNASGYDSSSGEGIRRCKTSISAGDLGRITAEGTLELKGRGGEMMNLNGNNIHPSEILEVFTKCGISEVRVGVESRNGEPILVAYTCSASIPTTDLILHLNKALPRYKIPRELVFLSSWPTTNSGKTAFTALSKYEHHVMKRVELR